MAIKIRYYLDVRRTDEDGFAPLRLMVNKNSKTALLDLDFPIKASDWDARTQKIVRGTAKDALNDSLSLQRITIKNWLMPKVAAGEFADSSVYEVRDAIRARLFGQRASTPFIEFWESVAATKSSGTAEVYRTSLAYVKEADKHLNNRSIQEITTKWCENVVSSRQGNTRNLLLSNLHSVMEAAVKQGKIASNPCAGIKHQRVKTARRDLTLEQMRKLWRYQPENDREERALDMFKASFLMRAANPVDMAGMTQSSIFNGRIRYTRAKTHKGYDVKIEPELQALIDKDSDAKGLFGLGKNYVYQAHAINQTLGMISKSIGLPEITMYWARHTFASLALELGVSVDLISAALGHSIGAAITMTYVNVKDKQVDEAARKVYDAVIL